MDLDRLKKCIHETPIRCFNPCTELYPIFWLYYFFYDFLYVSIFRNKNWTANSFEREKLPIDFTQLWIKFIHVCFWQPLISKFLNVKAKQKVWYNLPLSFIYYFLCPSSIRHDEFIFLSVGICSRARQYDSLLTVIGSVVSLHNSKEEMD